MLDMDNSEEISAFAAFSDKKQQKKIQLKNKSKQKLKKKKAFESNVNSPMGALMKAMDGTKPNGVSHKNKEKLKKKKKLIRKILEAQKESIFQDCTVNTKQNNIFLNNSNSNEDLSDEEHKESLDDSPQFQKTKKRKIMISDSSKKSESNQISCDSNKNNGIFTNGKESIALKPIKGSIEFSKVTTKNLLKESRENTKAMHLSSAAPAPDMIEGKTKLPNIIFSDSVKVGEEVFSWLLSPLSLKKFFKNCWEQKPVHVEHNDRNYFNNICTMEDFKAALREHDMFFTRNIDVTSYIDGERKTENPTGKAKPAIVWDFYNNGRSIRLLNPQTFIPKVRALNSALQEFFHCFVGANIYLTPPGTQGFAPHYDDIEAFVLQLDGEKHWKLYNPRSPEEVLPRESSRNFSEDEIGTPILEVTLKPGDLLYFPRGIIHQAKCLPHTHSLHITVSCYQKNSWADLLEKVLPVALQSAISEDVELRKGLPLGYLNSLGLMYCDKDSSVRQMFLKKFEELVQKVLNYCPIDAAVDQLGANFTHDALPPNLNQDEKLYGADREISMESNDFHDSLKNSSDKNLSVKLIRATSVRLVSEEEEMVLYYTTDNSLVYHEHEVSSITISTQWAQAIEYLIHSYPKFVQMKELPVSGKIKKPGKWKQIVEFVYFLWQRGLLLFDKPVREICN